MPLDQLERDKLPQEMPRMPTRPADLLRESVNRRIAEPGIPGVTIQSRQENEKRPGHAGVSAEPMPPTVLVRTTFDIRNAGCFCTYVSAG